MEIKISTRKFAILFPVDEDAVPWHHRVYGQQPDRQTSVLVYILARDNRWYQQGDVEFKGLIWQAHLQFGVENVPHGAEYKVVALITDSRFKNTDPGSSIGEIPIDLQQTE